MRLRSAVMNLALGSFGTKALIVILLLIGFTMKWAAIIVTILVVWRVVVVIRHGMSENFIIDPITHNERIAKDKEQWVNIVNREQEVTDSYTQRQPPHPSQQSR